MQLQQIRTALPAALILATVLNLGTLLISQVGASYPANDREQRRLAHNTSGNAHIDFQSLTQNVYKPTIRVWLHGDSIRPNVIRTRPGVIVLRAENETRSDVSLVLERVGLEETLPVTRTITRNLATSVQR